jgi:hypothetical protein
MTGEADGLALAATLGEVPGDAIDRLDLVRRAERREVRLVDPQGVGRRRDRTMPSMPSCSSSAATIGVPATCWNITTSFLTALYCWAVVVGSYLLSAWTSSTLYFPAIPPSSSLT